MMISSGFEDRLRDEMRQATAGVSPPSGLVRRARRGRRRRLTARAAATVATAAAVAVAVAVIPGAAGAPQNAETTAYVVKHVESALDTAATADDIAYVHATDGSFNAWLYNGPQGVMAQSIYSSRQGKPTLELGYSATSAGTTRTNVSYAAKIWGRYTDPARTTTPASPPASCGEQIPTDVSADALPVLTANIRQALACGQLTNEGTGHVNGVDAIKLVSVRPMNGQPLNGVRIIVTTTLWVDSATYLPVRWQIATGAKHQSAPPDLTEDITWLAPTSANLALLTVHIPPGFTQVRCAVGLRGMLPGCPAFFRSVNKEQSGHGH